MLSLKEWETIHTDLKKLLDASITHHHKMAECGVSDNQSELALKQVLWWNDYNSQLKILNLIDEEIRGKILSKGD